MSNASNAFETIIADLIFGRKNTVDLGTSPLPSVYRVHLLSNVSYSDGDTPVLVTGTGYSEQTINNDKTANGFNDASGPSVTNQKTIAFGPATAADWDDAYYIALFDNSGSYAAANLCAYIPITGAPLSIINGATVTFADGTLTLTLD